MSETRDPDGLPESERFKAPVARRDFLGMAAFWSCVATGGAMVVGMLRLPMPSVFPETGKKFRIGPPDRFLPDTTTTIADRNVLIRRDPGGIFAISLVCTHLGCITRLEADGSFICPCHGSRFDAKGEVTQGPAPSPLRYLQVSRAPSGDLMVDAERVVAPDVRLTVGGETA
jgi:cytochrome b6-f complex iron-sulfur subunit